MTTSTHLPPRFAHAARHELGRLHHREQRLERVVTELRRRAADRARVPAPLGRAIAGLEHELVAVRRQLRHHTS